MLARDTDPEEQLRTIRRWNREAKIKEAILFVSIVVICTFAAVGVVLTAEKIIESNNQPKNEIVSEDDSTER